MIRVRWQSAPEHQGKKTHVLLIHLSASNVISLTSYVYGCVQGAALKRNTALMRLDLSGGAIDTEPKMRALAEGLRANDSVYRLARQDSAEDFSRLGALLFTAMAWIFIPAHCFVVS